jgi:hypothetical protein
MQERNMTEKVNKPNAAPAGIPQTTGVFMTTMLTQHP